MAPSRGADRRAGSRSRCETCAGVPISVPPGVPSLATTRFTFWRSPMIGADPRTGAAGSICDPDATGARYPGGTSGSTLTSSPVGRRWRTRIGALPCAALVPFPGGLRHSASLGLSEGLAHRHRRLHRRRAEEGGPLPIGASERTLALAGKRKEAACPYGDSFSWRCPPACS